MTDQKKIESILRKIREKLERDSIPDDWTGSMKFNTQTGMVSGRVCVEVNL